MRSRFKWIFTLFLVFGLQFAFAQKTVTGTVTSATDNLPLPGVSVVVKGTNTGTTTDMVGKYSIAVTAGQTLEFSFVGMQTFSAVVGASNTIDAALAEDATTLEDVVVTAYGTQKREAITGSIAQLKSEEIETITTGNVLQGLTGKVAGVQISSSSGMPGDGPTIRIRGIGSINASAAPLYVVDGVPFSGDITMLGTGDVESMSFLKDASAGALYGNRGANGVIIITTKKGKKGKPVINFDTRTGFSDRAVEEYNLIEGEAEYYEAYFKVIKNNYQFAGNGVSSATAANLAAAGLINGDYGLNYNAYNTPDTSLIDPLTGKFTGGSLKYHEKWDDFLFNQGFFTQSHLDISGATDNVNYFFSAGYDKNDGYVVNSGFEKTTLRSKIDAQVTNSIKVGTNITYSNFTQKLLDGYTGSSAYSNPFAWTRAIAPIYPVRLYDYDGNPVLDSNGAQLYDDGTANGGAANAPTRPYGSIQNPYATAINDIWKYQTDNVFATGFVEAKIFDGLKATYTATADFNMYGERHMDTPLYGDAQGVNGRVSYTSNKTFALTQQQLLNYHKTFGKHTVDVLLGHETLKRRSDNIYAERQDLLIADGIVNHGATHTLGEGGGNYAGSTFYNLEGYFASLKYEFNNKYFINVNYRRDGSSKFDPSIRWGDFYGAGVAWRISQEEFLQNVSWLDELKIRGSYGEQGNDGILDFGYYQLSYIVPTNDPSTTGPLGNLILNGGDYQVNPDLTWETNINMNLGFDASFLKGRFTVEAEYFERKIEDMLYYRPLSGVLAFPGGRPENIGDMNNKGFEVTLSADVVKTKDFTFSAGVNATHYKNEITRLPDDNDNPGNRQVSGLFGLEEGGGRYDYFMRIFAGVNPNNGAALFWTNDGTAANEGVKQFLTENYAQAKQYKVGKTAIPDVYGGFNTSFKYKWLDLNVQFAYQMGGYAYDGVWASSLAPGIIGENMNRDVNKTWTSENTDAKLPRAEVGDPYNYYGTSTLGLVKSDYLSIQNISLGYSFAPKVVEKLGLSGLRIYGLVDNVYLWSKRQGFDPRIGGVTGASTTNYASLRTTSVGVNVKF